MRDNIVFYNLKSTSYLILMIITIIILNLYIESPGPGYIWSAD